MNTDFNKFKKLLNKEIVTFEYTKKDGTVRKAKGTTNFDKIPENQTPLEGARKYTPNENVTKYYDIEKEGWRSFNNESFKGFEDLR